MPLPQHPPALTTPPPPRDLRDNLPRTLTYLFVPYLVLSIVCYTQRVLYMSLIVID